MDCGLPGFSVRGILQARILEWVAISFSNQKTDRSLFLDILESLWGVSGLVYTSQFAKGQAQRKCSYSASVSNKCQLSLLLLLFSMIVHNNFICNTQNWKKSKCPSTGEWTNWGTSIQRDTRQLHKRTQHTTVGMDLDFLMLNERNQTVKRTQGLIPHI